MEETYPTTAIILKRERFREFDSRVVVYTQKKGKLELVARGTGKIQSKLAGHVEPLNLSSIMVVRGKQYDYIGGASSQDCFTNIKQDFSRTWIAGQAVRIFNKLVKTDESDTSLFFLLQNFLETLNINQVKEENNELFLHFFILKLLVQLGYNPELERCVTCQKKIETPIYKFDPQKGGVVCSTHKTGIAISLECINMLKLAIKSDFKNIISFEINNQKSSEIIKVVSAFYNYYRE